MPAIPAVTVHSHKTLDADPLRLQDELFVLMERATISTSSRNSQRFVDKGGNCFLRVESDQALNYNIQFSVLQNASSLGDYYPGRAMSDRSLAFATAGASRPHQFKAGGIFIYESSEDTDNQGELRKCSVDISYDLHGGLDTVNYPSTGATVTYTDIPQQEHTEISDTAKNYLLQDIFFGEENLGGDFTISAYNGDPATSGTLVAGPLTMIDPWMNVYQDADASGDRWACSPNEDIIFPSTTSARYFTHLRLKRGSIVITDVVFGSSFTIPANTYPRILASRLPICMWYGYTYSAVGTPPAQYFLPYVLGGTRFTHFPTSSITAEIYAIAPNDNPAIVPTDSWVIATGSDKWFVDSVYAGPSVNMVGTVVAGASTDIQNVTLKMTNTGVIIGSDENQEAGGLLTISAGNVYTSDEYGNANLTNLTP